MTRYTAVIFVISCISILLWISGYHHLPAFIPLWPLRCAFCKVFSMQQSDSALVLYMVLLGVVGLFVFTLMKLVGFGR